MILVVFLNLHDKQSYVLGREMPDYLKGDYVKIYTRYKDPTYEMCEIKDTLTKIQEYAQVFDKIIISFGLRLFPPSAYQDIIKEYNKTDKSIVFLKKLKGSKTWSVDNDTLKFDNYRIADTGLFILKAEDIQSVKSTNFNYFLHELIKKGKLSYKFVDYWMLTSPTSRTRKGRTDKR